MRRAFALACLALAYLMAGSLPAAGAAPAQVVAGKVRLANTPAGAPALLVPVAYPIEMAGRRVRLALSLRQADGSVIHGWTVRPVANAGPLRIPDRRQRFVFVHRIDLGAGPAAALRAGNRLHLAAVANLDADRDGKRELFSIDTDVQPVPLASGMSPLCATPPKRRARPGQRVIVPLPICAQGTRWTIAEPPQRGSARIRDGKLVFRAAKGFRGTVSITLAGDRSGASASLTPVDALAPVQIAVGTAKGPVVRAFGDSVTAGFGYFEKGESMPFEDLLSCKPGATSYDDACSSNSTVRSNKVKEVEYSKDYGLSNNVSWAAQWANTHSVTDYKNLAVSGSEPSDWFGAGQFAKTSKQIAAEDPDYVLFTMGANPLLSNMLFGVGNIGCGIWAHLFGRFQECVVEEFEEIKLHQNLKTLYSNLVKETQARIFVMQYHLSIPTAALYGVEQIAEMGNLLNAEIAAVAREVDPQGKRIAVVAPPHFDVGLALGQAYPSTYKCEGRFFSSVVDGRSVQAEAAQKEMGDLHPIEFCAGKKGEAPWVINGDSGIHPSAVGYAQMASKVPAPK
jgi:lysophospholipase L1-like esterase